VPSLPQKTPLVQKPTPVVLDQILIETADSNDSLYDRQFEFGHLHPNQIKYPGHRLLKQGPNSYGQYQYTWGNDLTAQDSYNVAKKYSAASNSHPVFVRSYRVLRSEYLVNGPLTKGTAFTGIVAINVTNGGSGYTKDFAITFSGGAGSGLAGIAIVNRGVVISVSLTNVGTGFTSAPTISFTNGSGTGAAATAVIQAAAAVLVEEEHSKLPDDDPYSSLYDRVTRVYETLPGPTLTDQQYDKDNNTFIFTDKTVKLTSQITEGLTFVDAGDNTVTLVESQAIDSLKSMEIATTWTEPAARSAATQIYTGERTLPMRLPNLMSNMDYWVLTGGLVGFSPAFTKDVPHVTRSYWVFTTAGEPTVVLDGALTLATVDNIFGDGRGYPDVIVDDALDFFFPYEGGTITVVVSGSTPTYADYLTDFIGGGPKAIKSVVTMVNRYLYRVDRIFVQYERQPSPTYS
jgi:hypothetical protein